jgi:hypothetical protein
MALRRAVLDQQSERPKTPQVRPVGIEWAARASAIRLDGTTPVLSLPSASRIARGGIYDAPPAQLGEFARNEFEELGRQ